MEQSEPLNIPNCEFSHFKIRDLRDRNKWQQLKRTFVNIWTNTPFLVKVVIFVVVLPCFLAYFSSGQRVTGFGLICSTSRDCESEANLECKKSRCECIQPKSGKAVFDISHIYQGWLSNTVGRCVIQPQGACNPSVNYPCAANSECTSKGDCECNHGFYFDQESKSCQLLRHHGEKCNSISACRPGFTCSENRCSCTISEMTFGTSFGTCVAKVGENCSSAKHSCVSGAMCANGKCICHEGLQASSDSSGCIPFLRLGENCSESLKCDQAGRRLVCINGRCNCDQGTSVPEQELGVCVPKAGQECFYGKCSSDSVCSPVEKGGFGILGPGEFQSGCSEDKELNVETGLCVSKHEGLCENDSDCAHSLVCKGSACRCPLSYQLFEAAQNRCLSKVNGECKQNGDCAGSSTCVSGHMRCWCYHYETSEGSCLRPDGRCKSDDDCDDH